MTNIVYRLSMSTMSLFVLLLLCQCQSTSRHGKEIFTEYDGFAFAKEELDISVTLIDRKDLLLKWKVKNLSSSSISIDSEALPWNTNWNMEPFLVKGRRSNAKLVPRVWYCRGVSDGDVVLRPMECIEETTSIYGDFDSKIIDKWRKGDDGKLLYFWDYRLDPDDIDETVSEDMEPYRYQGGLHIPALPSKSKKKSHTIKKAPTDENPK